MDPYTESDGVISVKEDDLESNGLSLNEQMMSLLQYISSDHSLDETSSSPMLPLSDDSLSNLHALATANLISQTQEAIMQEYNITFTDLPLTDISGQMIDYSQVDMSMKDTDSLDMCVKDTNSLDNTDSQDICVKDNDSLDMCMKDNNLLNKCVKDNDSLDMCMKDNDLLNKCVKDNELFESVYGIENIPKPIKDRDKNPTDENKSVSLSECGNGDINSCSGKDSPTDTLASLSGSLTSSVLSAAVTKTPVDIEFYSSKENQQQIQDTVKTSVVTSGVTEIIRHKRLEENQECNHTKTYMPVFTNIVDTKETINSDNFDKKIQNSDTWIKCPVCAETFQTETDLTIHCAVHRPFLCPYSDCHRRFTYPSHYQYHLQTHIGVKKKTCHCGKKFVTDQQLEVHQRTHTGSRPFICTHCQKSFSTAGNLINHFRIHTGEKPFVCDVTDCGKSFAEASTLKKHKLTHEGKKAYKCSVCGKGFAQTSSRKVHMRRHLAESEGSPHSTHQDSPSQVMVTSQ